jgi:outer membrane immunogenic protein
LITQATIKAEQSQPVHSWFDTLTGRLGYAVQPAWLLYFQGGAAWAHTSTNFSGPLISGQTSNSRTGWTIGGGIEWMFAPHWSAFLEGNYMDFGSNSGNVTFNTVPVPVTVKATESTVLVGVNYHFF